MKNFVIGESFAKISRFFPGSRKISRIFPGLLGGGGGGFHSSARNFVPLRVAEHFFELETERIQNGLCAKFSASSKWVFCRIRNERFQGNPGNRLAFFTVHMNVEIGAEAAQFPEKEYINGIAVAVRV